MFRSTRCWTCLMLIVFTTLASPPAGAARLYFLVKADRLENAAAVAEKIPNLPMESCKAARSIHLMFDEIIVVLGCGDVNENDRIVKDILKLSQMDHVKSLNLFTTEPGN